MSSQQLSKVPIKQDFFRARARTSDCIPLKVLVPAFQDVALEALEPLLSQLSFRPVISIAPTYKEGQPSALTVAVCSPAVAICLQEKLRSVRFTNDDGTTQ